MRGRRVRKEGGGVADGGAGVEGKDGGYEVVELAGRRMSGATGVAW